MSTPISSASTAAATAAATAEATAAQKVITQAEVKEANETGAQQTLRGIGTTQQQLTDKLEGKSGGKGQSVTQAVRQDILPAGQGTEPSSKKTKHTHGGGGQGAGAGSGPSPTMVLDPTTGVWGPQS